MARPRTIDRDHVLAVYAETGTKRETARRLGIHEQTVFSILKQAAGNCRDCGQPVKGGTVKCPACKERQNAAAQKLVEDHLRQELCAMCSEPWAPRSRRYCVKHQAALAEAQRTHRRKRMVNTTGTTLEREKEYRVGQDYGEGGVTAWKRDKGCCVLCDVSYADRMVFIHHLDRNRKHNTADNLVCLCYTCHRLVHGLSEHPHLLRFLDWFHTHYPATALPEKAQALLPRQKRSATKRPPAEEEPALLAFDFVGS